MTILTEEQLRHDRINLGRVIKRLEASIDNGLLNGSNLSNREGAWAVVQGITQKLKWARKLLSNLEMSKSFDPQSSYLQTVRNTLYRLEEIVELANKQVEPPLYEDVDYLSLVSLPLPVEDVVATNMEQSKLNVEPVVSDEPPPFTPTPETSTVPASFAPSSQGPAASLPPSSTPGSLLSSSLKTHEELSDELARMAIQLRRNAEHFSSVLEKDKGLVVSAEEALLKNADSMTRERERLKTHSSKSFGTTWFTIGAILVVCLASVWMFIIIRVT